MKQAIIITAYTDFERLQLLVNRLKEDFYLYIHIDKKSKQIGEKEIEWLKNISNCYVIKRYHINWGGMNHLYAIIELMKEIAKRRDVNYIHIITGQDYPIRTNKEIYDIVDKNPRAIYVYTIPKEQYTNKIKKRYWYHWYFDIFNERSKYGHLMNRLLECINKLFPKRRKIGDYQEEQIYKGLVYSSFPIDVLKYIISFIKENKKYMEDLATCKIPEEFFFQTILKNSKYAENIQNDNLRYCVWEERDGNSPAILDERDYEEIIHSNKIFMRKVGKESMKLIQDVEAAKGENRI